MLFYAAAASQEKLSADPREPHLPGAILGARPVARPLVPVTLALMVGIAAPAWGLRLPEPWLLAGGVVLWGVLALFWWQRRPARFLPLIFFGLLGVAFFQQAWQPDFPPGHLTKLPQHQNLTLFGHLNRPGKLAGERVQLFMEAKAWRSPWGWRPASGNLLVLAPVPEPPPVGAGLVVRGRLAPPHMLHNPGTFNRPRYLAADGLFREVRLADPDRLIFLAATEDYPWGERLRGGIRERLRELDPAGRAIYLAMLLGDQGEITPSMRQNFARTGTSHLLVINGLHLGMVASGHLLSQFLAPAALSPAPLAGQRGQDGHPAGGDPGGVLCLGGRGVALHPAGRGHGAGLPAAGLPGAPRGGLERPGPGGPHHPEPLAAAPLCHFFPALLCGGGLLDLPDPPIGQVPGGLES